MTLSRCRISISVRPKSGLSGRCGAIQSSGVPGRVVCAEAGSGRPLSYTIVLVSSSGQESGGGRAPWTTLPALLSLPTGAGAEMWLAEEAEKHHEELAAALVCAPW